MSEKELIAFYSSVMFSILLVIMIVFFIVISFRKRYIFFSREKENAELKHKQDLLEARQEMQQTVMQNIGADLHDNVGQKLTLAYLQMENMLLLTEVSEIKKGIRLHNSLIQDSLDELRSMSRILVTHDFSDFSFDHYVEKELIRIKQMNLCNTYFAMEKRNRTLMDERSEIALARICQEFIQNSLKHSGCSQIAIEVKEDDKGLLVSCSDDGKGIGSTNSIYSFQTGSGIRNIDKRVVGIQGVSKWVSNSNGTQLIVSIPRQKLHR